METRTLATTLMVMSLLFAGACKKQQPQEQPQEQAMADAGAPAAGMAPAKPTINTAMLTLFHPLPAKSEAADNPSSPEKVALGKMLYFDARISRSEDLSCNSCHHLDRAGTDGLARSLGQGHKPLGRNTPPLIDGAVQEKFFWDARASSVEQAVGMVLSDPEVMAMDEKRIDAVLGSMPEYVTDFKKAFPGDAKPITLANTSKALGAYLRTLLYPSRWDKYLEGDKTALTDAELTGLATFLDTGCPTCHQGAALGGTLVQKLGVLKPWPDIKDEGVFGVTKQETDKYFFKVAMLRNIDDTAPYMHDGSQPSLEETVTMMADYQLGKKLTPEQAKSIVTFFGALAGEPPAQMDKPPVLPKSTPSMPKPEMAPRANETTSHGKLPG